MSLYDAVDVPSINDTMRRLLLSDYFVRSYNYRRITRDESIMERFEIVGKPLSSESRIFLVFFISVLYLGLHLIFMFAFNGSEQSNRSNSIHRSRRQQNSLLKDIPQNSLLPTPQIMDRSEETNSLPDRETIRQMPSPAEETHFKFPSESGDVEVNLSRRVSQEMNAGDPTILSFETFLVQYREEVPLANEVNQPNSKRSNPARISKDGGLTEIMCSSENDVREKQNLSEESQVLKTPRSSNDTPIDDHISMKMEGVQTISEVDIGEIRDSLEKSQALEATLTSNDIPTDDQLMEKDVQTTSQDDICETRNSSKESQPLEALLTNDLVMKEAVGEEEDEESSSHDE